MGKHSIKSCPKCRCEFRSDKLKKHEEKCGNIPSQMTERHTTCPVCQDFMLISNIKRHMMNKHLADKSLNVGRFKKNPDGISTVSGATMKAAMFSESTKATTKKCQMKATLHMLVLYLGIKKYWDLEISVNVGRIYYIALNTYRLVLQSDTAMMLNVPSVFENLVCMDYVKV